MICEAARTFFFGTYINYSAKIKHKRLFHCRETEEIMAWNFLREVTENLILAQTYTDTALYQIFELAMENWKMKLPLVNSFLYLERKEIEIVRFA